MINQHTPVTEQNQEPKQAGLFAVLTVVISTVLCLFFAEYFMGWRSAKIANSSVMDNGLMRYDPQLGWTLNSLWRGSHHHHDFQVEYSTNLYGLRNGSEEHPFTLHQKTKPRIGIIGDSFTFGFGVKDTETFHAQLQELDKSREYLNIGVPGYSTDQQYLLAKKISQPYALDHILLVYYLGNDLLDNPMPYPLQAYRAKPYFTLEQQQLKLQNTPVPKTSKPEDLLSVTLPSVVFGNELEQYQSLHERWLASSHLLTMLLPRSSSINTEEMDALLQRRLSTHLKLNLALLQQIKILCEQTNMQLSLAIMPGQSFVQAPASYSAKFQDFVRRKIKEQSNEINISIIDIAAALQSQYAGNAWFFPHEGHLTEKGHRKVADIILEQLTTASGRE